MPTLAARPSSEPLPLGTIRTLKREGGRGVYLVRLPDGDHELVKRWPLSPWTLFKCLLGIAQPQRQLRGARRLLAAGIATPRPRGGVRLTTRGGTSLEIRLEWVEGQSLLERLLVTDDAERSRLGASMSELLQRIEAARLFHRDGKLSNFVVTPHGAIVAIDPVGVRRSRDARRERERAIEALACEFKPEGEGRCPAFFNAVRSGFGVSSQQ